MKKKKLGSKARLVEVNDISEVPEEMTEEANEVVELTGKITDFLRPYNVSVVVSALMSCLIQALCVTRSSKQEALEHAHNIGLFLNMAIEQADKEGICQWNSTLQ